MKKYLTVILLVCAICLLLSSCGGYKKGESFSKNFLQELSLEDMPLPNSDPYYLNTLTAGQETMRFEADRTVFNVYVKSFINYMKARDDIFYFGVAHHEGLIAEMFPHNVVCEIDDNFLSSGDQFTFCYSLDGKLRETSNCEHLCYDQKMSVILSYDGEKNLMYIKVSKNAGFGSDCIDEKLLTPYDLRLDPTGTYYRLCGVRGNLSGTVTLPESYKGLPVREIALWGFLTNDGVGSTKGVTAIIIPDCYEKMGGGAFHGMPGLKSVVIGNGIKEIPSGAFEDCANLETVLFGSSVEAIYAEAFQNCEKLDNVVLPATLKEITYRAFGYCKSLRTIVIPEGVTGMIADVFYENDSLTDVFCEADGPSEEWDPEWLGCDREYNENKDVRVTFGYGKETAAIYYPISFDTIGYSHEPIFADRASYLYKAGDTVEFYLEPDESGEAAPIYVNGELHEAIDSTVSDTEDGEKTLWRYSFTMPESHVVVSFEKEAE